MKKLLLIGLITGSVQASAQDYTGQHSGYVHFYRPVSSNHIYMVRCDSADLSGTDSLYWYRPYLRNTMDESIPAPCTPWGAPICYYLADAPTPLGIKAKAGNRRVTFYNYLDDSIAFNMNIPAGDSVLIYEDSLQRVRIKLLSALPATSFGFTDSLLTFTFLHTDLSDNVLPSVLHGSEISFSKLFGMMNGYAMDSFPHVLLPVTLEGVRGPDAGFHGISRASAVDLQAGDVYEIHTSQAYGMGGPVAHNYHRYTVLTRTDFPDRVEYYMKQDHQVYQMSMGWPYYYEYSTDTATQIYYKNDWVDEQPVPWNWSTVVWEQYFVDSTLLDCSFTTYSYTAHLDGCLSTCTGSNCYVYGDCYPFSTNDIKYTERAGMMSYNNHPITTMSQDYYQEIIYINAYGMECGQATLGTSDHEIQSQQVKIYPNPAGETVTIETGELTPHITSVYLSDITGKKIISSIAMTGSSTILSLAGLHTGTYWLGLQTTGSLVTKQLIVIR